MQDSFLLRIWLLFVSMISFLTSILYLFFFTLPHASWMPAVPDWQELAPKFLSQLHMDMDWLPDDGDIMLLLISITNFVGSLGYDRSTFYTMLSPYWSTLLTITSIYSLLMVLASVAMLCYLTYNYQLSHCFIPIPWIILNAILVFVVLVGLISLLGDINSTSRLQMEHMLGKGNSNYAMVITGMMVTSLFLWFCILAAYIHMENMMMEKEREDRLEKLFSLVDDSFSSHQPDPPQHQPPSYSQLYQE